MNLLLALTVLASSTFASNGETVELQWAICESSAESFFHKSLQNFQPDGSYRQYYVDTADHAFERQGVSLHVRDSSGGILSKLKITFERASDADLDWIKENGGGCEFDQYGPRRSLRCEIENESSNRTDAWSAKQREFLRVHKKSGDISAARSWGPFPVEKWKSKKEKLKLDVLEAPGGKNVLELSHKASENAAERYEEITQWLRERKINLCGKQQGKYQRLVELCAIGDCARK
jgi:hypothetical protein